MNKRLPFVVSLFTLILASAGASASGDRDVAAIRHARLQQNEAIARHDLNAMAAGWTDDVTVRLSRGAQAAGKAAYRALWEPDVPGSPGVIIYERVPTDIATSRHWPLAFEAGVWKGHLGDIRGAVVIQGRYSAQWVKRAGQWLIRSEVFVALDRAGPGLQMTAEP